MSQKKVIFVSLLLFTILYKETLASELTCEVNDDCPALNECTNNICQHKPLFPLTFREILSTIIIMILSGVANAGGLGGGALLSPILLIGFNYDASKSIMIVYALVFGGALGNFLNVALQKDPKTGKPLVEYDLSLIAMPPMLMGTAIGVLMNRIAPSIVIIVGLVLLMRFTLKKIYAKAKQERQKELQLLSEPLLKLDQKATKDIEMESFNKNQAEEIDASSYSRDVVEALKQEKQLFPTNKIKLILGLLAWIIIMALIRGTDKLASVIGVEYCGIGYWALFFISLIGCGYFYNISKAEVESALNIKRLLTLSSGNDFQLTNDKISSLTSLSAIAGVLAGFLGIGGGMVMGPTLLALGCSAQTLAATSGFFVVQTSFISLFQALLYGDVELTEVFYFLVCALVGSYGVSAILTYYVKKYRRPSLILFTLSYVIIISMIIMPLFGLWKSIDNPGQMLHFKPLC